MAGAFVHYHGISLMAIYRLRAGECPAQPIDRECLLNATNTIAEILTVTEEL